MKKRTTFLALFIAVICSGYEVSLVAQASNIYPPYTMRLRTTARNPDGSASLADEVRYFNSGGDIHMMRKLGDGRIDEWFLLTGRGRFVVDHRNNTVVHEAPDGPRCRIRTAKELISSPNFLRQELMLGITAYIHRFVDPNNGLPLRDVYYAPEIGCQAMKMIHYRDGIAERITEAVSIDFGEPDVSTFSLPDYPLVGAR